MIDVGFHNVRTAEARHYPAGEGHKAFSCVCLRGDDCSVTLYVSPDQAEAIAAAFSPKVNSAGVPVYEGRAAQ